MQRCAACNGTKKISPLGCIAIDCKQCNASGYVIPATIDDSIKSYIPTRDTGEVVIDSEPKPAKAKVNRFKRKAVKKVVKSRILEPARPIEL